MLKKWRLSPIVQMGCRPRAFAMLAVPKLRRPLFLILLHYRIRKYIEPLSKVRMLDEMRGGSRRIADGNPAVAQGANDEPFQDSSGS
jgi:hypothetical protein